MLLAIFLLIIILFTKFTPKKFIHIGLLSIILLLGITIGACLNSEKNNVEFYKQKLYELKAQQYDLIKNKANIEKIQKNERKIKEVTEKYNKAAKEYNEILEKDEKRFILFKFMSNREKFPKYDIETNIE